MTSPQESSVQLPQETSPEHGGSIWKALRTQQLASLKWWDKFNQKNSTATARDAWRGGHGQPDCTKGLFDGAVEDEVINVDSPTTIYHQPPQSDILKTLLLAGSIAMAGTGIGTGLGIGAWMLSGDDAKPQQVETRTETIERDYQIGEITVE